MTLNIPVAISQLPYGETSLFVPAASWHQLCSDVSELLTRPYLSDEVILRLNHEAENSPDQTLTLQQTHHPDHNDPRNYIPLRTELQFQTLELKLKEDKSFFEACLQHLLRGVLGGKTAFNAVAESCTTLN